LEDRPTYRSIVGEKGADAVYIGGSILAIKAHVAITNRQAAPVA
jgi:hypothetical protein